MSSDFIMSDKRLSGGSIYQSLRSSLGISGLGLLSIDGSGLKMVLSIDYSGQGVLHVASDNLLLFSYLYRNGGSVRNIGNGGFNSLLRGDLRGNQS